VLTAGTEITDRVLIFGERHLCGVPAEYKATKADDDPHRSRQLRAPSARPPTADLSQERIKRRAVLGGLISEYEQVA
jgi:putative transposase